MNHRIQWRSVMGGILCAFAIFCVAVSVSAYGQNMSGSFDGWRQVGNANWRIENGEFVANEGNGHLVTERSFQDVRISAEFYVDSPTANSGIYFRITDVDRIRDTTAYEANINETTAFNCRSASRDQFLIDLDQKTLQVLSAAM